MRRATARSASARAAGVGAGGGRAGGAALPDWPPPAGATPSSDEVEVDELASSSSSEGLRGGVKIKTVKDTKIYPGRFSKKTSGRERRGLATAAGRRRLCAQEPPRLDAVWRLELDEDSPSTSSSLVLFGCFRREGKLGVVEGSTAWHCRARPPRRPR